jgi:hypothetical protein
MVMEVWVGGIKNVERCDQKHHNTNCSKLLLQAPIPGAAIHGPGLSIIV